MLKFDNLRMTLEVLLTYAQVSARIVRGENLRVSNCFRIVIARVLARIV